MKKQLLFIAFCFFFFVGTAQESFRLMFYNILDFPEAIPPERPEILGDIIEEIDPDIFMVCELQSEEGADIILNTSLNRNGEVYARAPFIPSRSGALEHQQLIFYKRKMFTLETTEALPTEIRDINYFQLKLNTADQATDPVVMNFFVTHLKSSPGNPNEQLRLDMVNAFLNKTETLPEDSFVIFAGDFNLYTSQEPAYQALINSNNFIVMADPLDRPGHWHENMNFTDIHSQSTRIYAGPFGAGAGGGLDDRFDFILLSENMLEDPKLKYVPHSYQTFGNNGNCYKNNVHSRDCTGYYSGRIRNKLYNMSDHLPIVLDLETNKEIVLGTTSHSNENQIRLRETIIKNFLNIEINSPSSHVLSFEIYSIFGQKIMDFDMANQDSFSINLEFLSDGMYFLKSNLQQTPALKFLKSS